MYSNFSFIIIILLPHSLKDRILTWGSALTLNFMTSFSWATVVFRLLPLRCLLEHETSLLEIVPLLSNSGMCFVLIPKSWLHFGSTTKQYGKGWWQHVFFWTNKHLWTGLVDLNFLPTCVLHSGTYTCLRVNLLCAIWADGYTMQINLKTLSKPMVWSDAYKCCFFFCLLYEMCYFALSLLKHTFLKNK